MGINLDDLSFVKKIKGSFTDYLTDKDSKNATIDSVKTTPVKTNKKEKTNLDSDLNTKNTNTISIGSFKKMDNDAVSKMSKEDSDKSVLDSLRTAVSKSVDNRTIIKLAKDYADDCKIDLNSDVVSKLRENLINNIANELVSRKLSIKTKSDLQKLIKKLCNIDLDNKLNNNQAIKNVLSTLTTADLLKILECLSDPKTSSSLIGNFLNKNVDNKYVRKAANKLIKSKKLNFTTIASITKSTTREAAYKEGIKIGKSLVNKIIPDTWKKDKKELDLKDEDINKSFLLASKDVSIDEVDKNNNSVTYLTNTSTKSKLATEINDKDVSRYLAFNDELMKSRKLPKNKTMINDNPISNFA